MSLKQEIETWVEALGQYDNNEFEEALKTFDNISDTSKILFNCGVIHATLGEHDKAIECYQRATGFDQYLAVAYFQQGVSNFLIGDFEEALANFNDTLLYLRGNTYIDYEQLGLKFKLYSCEVLFNRGLCYIYLQQKQAGLGDLSYAAKEKVTPDHDVIDEAIREEAEGYTVFSIPVGVIYRPNSSKVKNLKTKDYLGKARLIASSDKGNMFTGFTGAERRAIITAESKDDRPEESISFAASNLVRSDLTSRSVRQKSAPPINRNQFPPTPPPENDRPGGLTARANSIRDGSGAGLRAATAASARVPVGRRPTEDAISPKSGNNQFNNPYANAPQDYPPPLNTGFDKPRVGTVRTASEPRGPVSRYTRGPERGYANGPPTSRGRLFMETTPTRGGLNESPAIDEYPEELYDLYRNTAYSNPYGSQPARNSGGGGNGLQRSATSGGLSYDERDSGGSSLDDFEMLNDAGGSMSMRAREASRSRGTSRSRRPVDIRTVRVKMHAGDDTRYLMVSTTIAWEEFLEKVREKLRMKNEIKIRMKDEGDMITVGDRDDWEMAVQTGRREARRAGEDMARLEVWVV